MAPSTIAGNGLLELLRRARRLVFDRIPGRWRLWTKQFLRDWALTVVLGVVALLACAKLGEDVFSHETGTFDEAIQRWVDGHQSTPLYFVFFVITYLGSVGAMIAIALVGALWLWRRRGRHVAAGALIAPAAAIMLFMGIKQIFARARPPLAGHLVLGTYAFPSGHATASTAVCCTLAYVYWREGFISRRAAIWIATLLPFLIGVSRVYLDVHWATDVLGGWSLGLLVAVLGGALYDRNRRRQALTENLGDAEPTA
jgi:membrane-associated phospholipid phosphatase